MPTAAPTFRPPGAQSPVEARRAFDARRRSAKPWRRWYASATWRRLRAAQLALEPYCGRCARDGRTAAATVVNHVTPHRGDRYLFVNGQLESLCEHCHNAEVQREERAGG